jgi:D-alanine-D-alanine ligase
MKILVLYGGDGFSLEAEISKLSGRQVTEAAKTAGFDVTEFVLTKDNLNELKSQLKNFDVVFPVLHGKFGEDGGIQTLLESANVKYVGSDATASQLCFDKPSTQAKLKSAGVLIPEFHIVTAPDQFDDNWLPCVIKPPQGGSSVDTFVWKTADLNQLSELLARYGSLMAEQYIQGRELTVGILDNAALPAIEIIPPEGQWFDYKNKYTGKSQEIVNPQLSPEIIQAAQVAAVKAHQACGCRHLSRVDFILQDNQLFCLEINTMPGFTTESLYPKAAKAAGYNLPDLVKRLIELAV